MYDKINTLADSLEEDIMKMKAHEALQQQEVELESIEFVGTGLSAVITWVGFGLCAAEPHGLLFLCMCQLDLATVSEFRSIERFRTPDTGHCTTCYGHRHFADLTNST